MARGPRPEPAAIKEAKGNPSRRPIGTAVLEQEAGKAVKPTWLKGEALAIWDRLAPRVEAMKLLTAVDAEAFGRYCRAFARWVRVNQQLDEEGETYESESQHGKLKRIHPAFMISDRLEKGLLAFEDRFGLNPAERQRIFAARAAGAQTPGPLFGDDPQPPAPDRPSGPLGLLN